MPDDLMFDPKEFPLPFPLPIPGPWFPKYPQRASMSFGDFTEAVNAAPADSPVWAVVDAVKTEREAPVFDAVRSALQTGEGIEVALERAYQTLPKLKAALRAGTQSDEEAARLLHPFFLAVEWDLVTRP